MAKQSKESGSTKETRSSDVILGPVSPYVFAVTLPAQPIKVIRPDDLLVLTFSFVNFQINVASGQASLVRIGKPALIIVEFQPQSIIEEFVSNNARTRIAGTSRLVFRVTADSYPYSIEGLLRACGEAELVPGMNPAPSGFSLLTALEVPYGLIVSPQGNVAWAHAYGVVTHQNRAELWHTRLAAHSRIYSPFPASGRVQVSSPQSNQAVVVEKTDGQLSLRAIGLPEETGNPFTVSALTSAQRVVLVDQMKAPNEVIHAKRLMLSALGAWMDTHYATALAWAPGVVVDWQHRMTMGRDHYVRVLTWGYLFPFGHRAAHMEVTERKFDLSLPGQPAYLIKKEYLIVLEHVKENTSLGMPFSRVEITTTVTPELTKGPVITVSPELAFWPQVGQQDFQFHIVATDWDGQCVAFSSPLAFVSEADEGTIDAVIQDYATQPNAGQASMRNQIQMNGQSIAFAKSVPAGAEMGDAKLTTTMMTLIVNPAQSKDAPFLPMMQSASVHIPALEKLMGNNQPATIQFSNTYLASGFDGNKNKGQVFAELTSKPSLTFPGDKSGGLVTPNMVLTGLSRTHGAVAGALKTFADGTFDPAVVFGNAKILGAISLKDILVSTGLDQAPRLITQPLVNGVAAKPGQTPDAIRATYDWTTTTLKADSAGIFKPDGARLKLHSELTTPMGSTGAPQSLIHAMLENFGLTLFKVIRIDFSNLEFKAQTGQKVDVNAILTKSIKFVGMLSFVNILADHIPADGFKDPPSVDVTSEGVAVGYSLALPSIVAGAWGIENIKMSAGLTIPFTDKPVRFRFGFSDRHDPFHVIAYGLTGGGFLGLALGLDGMESLEAGVELGGSLGINLVVAAGSVSIMVGIRFNWEIATQSDQQDAVALTGYARANGEVEILEVASVSIEFYMGLTYEFNSGLIVGQAEVTVEIDVLFFSDSVSFEVEKTFDPPV